LSNQNWWRFYEAHKNKIRSSIVICITKLLSCKNIIRGYQEYRCSNPNCSHIKRIPHTCKCKACSSCGKKATELWIQKQNHLLPNTSWQHITFTMPSELWDFFWYNRKLLNKIGKIAANCVKTIADKKKVMPGVFIAIHTFGRDLRNFKLTAEQFIARFIQHIPDTGFRMIRYYGFLANRVRGKLLPIVYQLIGQDDKCDTQLPSYANLIQKNFNFNPLTCILCGQKLLLSVINFGKYNTWQLLQFHRELATLKIC